MPRLRSIRIYADVTIRVPFDTVVDLNEFEKWAGGDPPNVQNLTEFLEGDEEDSWADPMPTPDIDQHNTVAIAVSHIELIDSDPV